MPFSSSLRVTPKARLGGLTVDVWPVPISHRPARSKDLTVSHRQSAANTVLSATRAAGLTNATLFGIPSALILLLKSGLSRGELILRGGASDDKQRRKQYQQERGNSHNQPLRHSTSRNKTKNDAAGDPLSGRASCFPVWFGTPRTTADRKPMSGDRARRSKNALVVGDRLP
jgi:hypothetical protein